LNRLPSGSARLDAILRGGLPANTINLVIGAPGSGKTILSQQYVFRNATPERPGLYLSTVSEPFDKLIRYAQTLEFFDAAAIGSRVVYDDLGASLRGGGLASALARVEELIRTHHPGLLVIDSFKALRPLAGDEGEFRRFLHDMAGLLTAAPVTTFWVGEYDREQASGAAEFAVADAIIALHTKRLAARERRVLQVLKLRGSGFASGEHGYRIGPRGVDVFPRLADVGGAEGYALGAVRQATGVEALDRILEDGYWPGSTTLVCGPSGVGKTLLGLHFIMAGAAAGEDGIVASLQENPVQLGRIARSFGWALDDPRVHLLVSSPVDLNVDQWVYQLLDLAERHSAKRIMVDSLSDIRAITGDDLRFREWMFSLTQRCSRSGTGLLLTLEMPEIYTVTRASDADVTHLADNVLILSYRRDEDRLGRVLTVLKTRASRHHTGFHRYEIGDRGILITAPEAG
jgi:circadian clock protein KaiC